MAEDIKCLTESRMRAMEIIKQKMVEMKNQNEKLSKFLFSVLVSMYKLLLGVISCHQYASTINKTLKTRLQHKI